MAEYRFARLIIAQMKFRLDDPKIREFVDRLEIRRGHGDCPRRLTCGQVYDPE